MARLLRVVIGLAAIILGISLALTTLTSADVSTCQLSAQDTSEGEGARILEHAPVYLEVMSGDAKLNQKLRELLARELVGHQIVERAARHAASHKGGGAVGVKLIVTMWAPKWMPFWGRSTTTLDSELRVGSKKLSQKTTMAASCTGLVNQERFLTDESERMVQWTVRALGL